MSSQVDFSGQGIAEKNFIDSIVKSPAAWAAWQEAQKAESRTLLDINDPDGRLMKEAAEARAKFIGTLDDTQKKAYEGYLAEQEQRKAMIPHPHLPDSSPSRPFPFPSAWDKKPGGVNEFDLSEGEKSLGKEIERDLPRGEYDLSRGEELMMQDRRLTADPRVLDQIREILERSVKKVAFQQDTPGGADDLTNQLESSLGVSGASYAVTGVAQPAAATVEPITQAVTGITVPKI